MRQGVISQTQSQKMTAQQDCEPCPKCKWNVHTPVDEVACAEVSGPVALALDFARLELGAGVASLSGSGLFEDEEVDDPEGWIGGRGTEPTVEIGGADVCGYDWSGWLYVFCWP